jgi:hypothetical protein
MSINTTGVPSTQEYLIGRGVLQLAMLNDDGTPQGFKDVGNVPTMTLNVESEEYEHFSSRQGLKTLDMSATISQTASSSFVIENVQDFGNLKFFFSGEASKYDNPAQLGWTGGQVAKEGTVAKNTYYMIMDKDGNPAFQLDGTKLTIQSTNATPVTLTEGTDYTVDAFSGQIFLTDTSVIQTIIDNGDGLTSNYDIDAQAADVDVLEAQTSTSVTVAMRFVSENASNGDKKVYDMHKVTLSADGDFSLISDEVTQAPMAAKIEKSAAYKGTISIYAPGERTT